MKVRALGLACAACALHLAFAFRYGYFRDELYFIACAQHLAWGYADQPPLVAIAAWLTQPAAYAVWALRVVPALCAGATVYAACAIAARLGGNGFAQVIASIAIVFAPVDALVGGTLTTTSFEPLTWTLLAYCFLRLLQSGEQRWWIRAGIVLGFALWAKYTIILFALAFVAALLATPQRRLLFAPCFAAGLLLAAIIIAPNAAWQIAHGLPMLAVMHGDVLVRAPLQNGMQLEFQGLLANGAAFLAENLVFANPFALPIWLLGLYAFARNEPWKNLRPLALTYAILVVVLVALEAKAYYLIGFYPLLLAAGAVRLEALVERAAWRRAAAGALIALNLPILPFTIPVLPIGTFVAYTRMLGLTGRNGTQPIIVQPLYADEFGWNEAVARVASAYDRLPANLRARTAIFADSYAYASALERYGPRYGLPPPISGSNAFWIWGTEHYDGSSMLAVGATDYRLLLRSFGSVTMVAVVRDARRAVIEGPLPIYLCRHPRRPLAKMWPRFAHYGA